MEPAGLTNYDFGNDRFQVYDGRGGRPACDLRKLSYRYRRIREIYNQVPLAALPARREVKANCLPFDSYRVCSEI